MARVAGGEIFLRLGLLRSEPHSQPPLALDPPSLPFPLEQSLISQRRSMKRFVLRGDASPTLVARHRHVALKAIFPRTLSSRQILNTTRSSGRQVRPP